MENQQADKIIQLLQEIKELQQQHAVNYEKALRNQEESITLQKNYIARLRRTVLPIAICVVILIVIVVFMILRLLLRYRF